MSVAEDFLSKKQVRLHVYKLPTKLSRGFAFGGGNEVPFLNVDFFDVPWDIQIDELVEFIKAKRYYAYQDRFLVLAPTEYRTLTFTIEPEAEIVDSDLAHGGFDPPGEELKD